MMQVQDDITFVKGVGPALAAKLDHLGVSTVSDMLMMYPRRYVDYSQVAQVQDLRPGNITIKAHVNQVSGRYIRGGLHVTEAIASDDSGSVRVVWFNQPYRAGAIKTNTTYYISGIFELRRGRLAITNPSMELESQFPVNTARIVPVYRETKGLTSVQIRKILATMHEVEVEIEETLPRHIIESEKLLSRQEAIWAKHFPKSMEDLARADERLGFEELFELILASLSIKQSIKETNAVKIPFNEAVARDFVAGLPFNLTGAQRKSVWQIYKDMSSEHPMNRLLEGDVGAGKTVVAAMAAVMVMNAIPAANKQPQLNHQTSDDLGYQVAFMAPTELLARQHSETLYKLLTPLNLASKICLLVGGMTSAEKARAQASIEKGRAQLIVGTHALIQASVRMSKLALVVVDEQHRFGVDQRKKLLAKSGFAPHMLSMTATPIPRSLALTVFGELDISILDEKPSGREPVVTKLINPSDRPEIYQQIDEKLQSGQQMFVVCPLIEDSKLSDIKSAEQTYRELLKQFKNRRISLLHGRMKPVEKQSIMADFVNGKTDIIVSTTVIEVGVDVPNATVMMIEAPERFGLAQLHQLRGRVGRGSRQGICYLMLSGSGTVAHRLRAIESTNDGFKLAELDLELRGAGALYGTSQHGALDLRIANFTDAKLVARARQAAKQFMSEPSNLVQYPRIKQRITELQSVVHLN